MDWFPWYFTIYEQETMHLNPYQDGCYRRLIDHYMKTRAPLPDNDAALARIIGDSLENWAQNASRIVRAFFKPKNGVLLHKFCDKILDEQDSLSKSRSKSAKIAAEKRWQKNKENQKDNETIDAARMPDAYAAQCEKPFFDATGQDNTGQIDIIPPIIPPKVKLQKPDDVSPQVWADFLSHRKAKKAPVTETVLSRFRQEAAKIGWTLEQAMIETCHRGWQGFKAEFIQPNRHGGLQNGPTRLTRSQQLDLAAEQALAELNGQISD